MGENDLDEADKRGPVSPRNFLFLSYNYGSSGKILYTST